MMLIIFFQSLIWNAVKVPFLSESRGISLTTFIFRSFLLSFGAGALLTLGIKGIFNNYTEQNDGFDL
jgi:hypothetical protein